MAVTCLHSKELTVHCCFYFRVHDSSKVRVSIHLDLVAILKIRNAQSSSFSVARRNKEDDILVRYNVWNSWCNRRLPLYQELGENIFWMRCKDRINRGDYRRGRFGVRITLPIMFAVTTASVSLFIGSHLETRGSHTYCVKGWDCP